MQLAIETTSNCTGTTVGNASVTYTITAGGGNDRGTVRVSGIAVDAGASAQPYSLCAAVTSGAGDSDIMNWGIEALVIDTGADLAEVYTTNDASIEVGDVVSLDSNLKAGMQKSRIAYDQSVFGIVSTRPGLVIGSVEKEGVNALPVALSGRVPVKVSAQNGALKAGDYLTTSTIPGVAMKATKAGAIIGTAMTSFDGEGTGQILVFVKNGYSGGSIANEGNEEVQGAAAAVKPLVSSPPEVDKAESDTEINLVDRMAEIVADLFKNTIEFFGKVIFHADITFLGRPTFNSDTAGHVSLKAGDSEVAVVFAKEYSHKPVVTASINLVDGIEINEMPAYAIYNVSSRGFTIKVAKPASLGLSFSWIALLVPEGAETESESLSPSPTPSLTPSLVPAIVSTDQVIESPATASPSPTPDIVPIESPNESPSPTPLPSQEVETVVE